MTKEDEVSSDCTFTFSTGHENSTDLTVLRRRKVLKKDDNDQVKIIEKSWKKYPKLTRDYPKIIPNDEIVKKLKKKTIDLKPPCSQPPVFLKCKINESDLDIHMRIESLTATQTKSPVSEKATVSLVSSETDAFQRYRNVGDNKIVPCLWSKNVICDTVDAWADNVPRISHYKPIIFKGTFPIDLPIGLKFPKTFDIDCPINDD